MRESLGLSENHPALAIFDVFAAHRSVLVLESLMKHHIKYVTGSEKRALIARAHNVQYGYIYAIGSYLG